jgi:aspartyl protease family protein
MDELDGPWAATEPPPPPPRRRGRLGLYLWLGLLAATVAGLFVLTRFFPGQLDSGADRFEAMRLFGLLALVSSGLVASRRLDLGQSARHAAIWAAILTPLVVGYTFRDDFVAAIMRVRTAINPAYGLADAHGAIVIGRGEGGGFYVMGKVNGAPVRFLIDTGATEIVLSPADAGRAGLSVAGLTYSDPSETANGVGYGAAARIGGLDVGSVHLADVPVTINRTAMSASLLGMPFLDHFTSIEVKGDRLFLRGRRQGRE